jgi:hypothetical protein
MYLRFVPRMTSSLCIKVDKLFRRKYKLNNKINSPLVLIPLVSQLHKKACKARSSDRVNVCVCRSPCRFRLLDVALGQKYILLLL